MLDSHYLMQPGRKKSIFHGAARPALAGLMAVFLVFISTLAASPSLHQLIHSDAGAPGHQCVVTLFSRGQVNAASTASIIIVAAAIFGGTVLLAETLVLPSANYRFSSSRAPPSFLSLV